MRYKWKFWMEGLLKLFFTPGLPLFLSEIRTCDSWHFYSHFMALKIRWCE